MGWVREGSPPAITKVSFIVSAEDHPELAAWIWSLPYRKASSCIRDVLEVAAKTVSAARGEQSGGGSGLDMAARDNSHKAHATASPRIPVDMGGVAGDGAAVRREPQGLKVAAAVAGRNEWVGGDVMPVPGNRPAGTAPASANINVGGDSEMSDAVVEAMSKLDSMFP